MEDLLVSTGLITKACYRTFFHQYNFFDGDCLKALISKGLGYVVIAGSVGVKIPQIRSIVKAKSAAGISLSMFLLELIGYSINLSYNVLKKNPFSTWGEILFLLIQTTVILALMQFYSGNLGVVTISIGVAWIASLAALITGQVPMEVVILLQTASVGIFIMSKVPQVITNFRNKSTGKLAFFTFFLNTAGAAARIFTTLQEVPDTLILSSAVLGFVLNLIITLQIVVFGDREAANPAATASTKKAPEVPRKPERISAPTKSAANLNEPRPTAPAFSDDEDAETTDDSTSEGSTPRGEASTPKSASATGKKEKSGKRKKKLSTKSDADDSSISSSSEAVTPSGDSSSKKDKKDKKDKKEKEKKEKDKKKKDK